ncbi:MAG: DUF3471 domain-containing protein [Acidobacteriia bacterium]|nr:DUF3471 domain-containing protein [Terriglobia bacterium]
MERLPIAGDGRRLEIGPSSYGMGWFLTTYRGHKLVHHSGNIDGFSALVTMMPREKMGMVILTNMNGSPMPTVLSYHVYDRLLGLAAVDWTGQLREDEKKGKEGEEEAKKKNYTPRKAGTKPSHALADYDGSYEHPGYGVMKIKLEGDQLRVAFNGLSSMLGHYHYDVFEAVEDPVNPVSKMKFQFQTGLSGDVEGLAVPLESTLKPIVFTRMADEAMRKREFLEPLTGEYSIGPLTAAVALQGESVLTLTVSGQPRYEMVPVRELTFQLKGLTGFRVEFKKDGAGKVIEAVFHQPNGIVAKRKP